MHSSRRLPPSEAGLAPSEAFRDAGRASPDHIRGRPSVSSAAGPRRSSPSAVSSRPPVESLSGRRRPRRPRGPVRCSISAPGYGLPPQIRQVFPVHILGTAKLSRSCPQGRQTGDDRARSTGCGFVDKRSPQAVDRTMIHSLCTKLSTDDPQAGPACPQRSCTSPHACPLFGNVTRPLTGSSERRHTKVPRGPVGKTGKPGDGAGDNSVQPVHGVCRTFCSPQKPRVVHRLRPQGQWTKSGL